MSADLPTVPVPRTPTPWRLGRDGTVVSDSTEGLTIVGSTDANSQFGAVAFYGGNLICESVTSANAEFIVRAANAHDALLEAFSHVRWCRECGETDMERCIRGRELLDALKLAGIEP